MGRVKRKVPSNVCKMRRLRPSCTCAKYHPCFCSPFIYSVVSNDSDSDKEGPDQADLGLRCPHMPKDTFSHGAARVIFIQVKFY